MNPACSMNPNPMVMMFSMSFSTTARMNNSTRPLHKNKMMSRLGVRSDSPVMSARKLGRVAQCNTMAANQPNVSAESRARLLVT